MWFLEDFDVRTNGPKLFGDTYQNLLVAVASNRTKSLPELLLSFGVTDVEGLMFLLRIVSLNSTVEALRWASDDTIGLDYLHGTATISHPLTMALHHPEIVADPEGYAQAHPELFTI
jgi:hypothetical protein